MPAISGIALRMVLLLLASVTPALEHGETYDGILTESRTSLVPSDGVDRPSESQSPRRNGMSKQVGW